MRELGRLVRLQIQRTTLKTGLKPERRYDPAPILARVLGAGPVVTGLTWALAGAPVLAAECWIAVRLLGPVLEKLEPAGVK